jgi:hypothetical protein
MIRREQCKVVDEDQDGIASARDFEGAEENSDFELLFLQEMVYCISDTPNRHSTTIDKLI